MAYYEPPLYNEAKKKGIRLPQEYDEFSFHSYNCIPLPTNELKAYEVLRIRDENFHRYFSRPEFLERLKEYFGSKAKQNVEKMLEKKLKRKIIEMAI